MKQLAFTALVKNRILQKIGITILILLIPVDIIFLYGFYYLGQVYPKVTINQYSVGGKDSKEIADMILGDLKHRQETVTLLTDSQKYQLSEANLDLRFDIDQTIENAYQLGRNKDFFQNTYNRFNLLQHGKKLQLVVLVNETNLDEYIASIAAGLNEPMIPPTITIESSNGQKEATVSAGRTGKELDTKKTKTDIVDAFASQNFNPITLQFNQVAKPVSQAQIDKTQSMANQLLNKKIILKQDGNNWELNGEELINFLSFYDTFEQEKIASWSAQLAQTIDRPPENALFEFDGEKVTAFKPAKDGLVLNQEDTTQAIKTGILTLVDQKDQTEYDITLKIQTKEPDIKTGELNDLGIKELIGKGESWFGHSIAGRIHNLTLAASKFHGVLIKPGEEFSFNKTVGEIDQAHGYQQAYIIKEGRTVLGDGGGVCQVSTTLFRAALDAGLDITERHAHAYRVSYYEQNYEVGVDATVFSPSTDFKFINDTPGHILIQTMTDPNNLYMRFELFGTSDGRQVEISKSRVWDQTPPPPDMYQDDPTLPAGVVKQIDWAAWGAKTAFDWKVVKNNEVLHEKTFYSTYKPWQAIYLKGTGGV
ncbi:hypothetical protein GYA49_02950 [Candidatus Beckwithbacteria bacterium]|nr:hypothetical protein [Candidatus Beckwithbacteria bacterium]